MKNRKVTKVLAAVLTGAMLMATPSVVMAKPWYGYSNYTLAVNPAIPTVQNLGVSYDKGEAFLYWTPITLTDSQTMYIEYSSDPTFPNSDKTYSYYLDKEDALAGKVDDMRTVVYGLPTYYRAVIRDYTNQKWDETTQTWVTNIGAYSNVVQYAAKLGKISPEESRATKKSAYFKFYFGGFTGVEIYRAEENGKYKKIAVTTDAEYTDKGLESETTYRYKFRGYVMDPETKQKAYGEYSFSKLTTWGSDMNVEAKAKNDKTVKLTWEKVKGATSYEIYRAVGSNYNSTIKDGYYGSGNTNWKLVKVVKAKAKSFTDKKLKKGETYSYKVVAVNEQKENGKVKDTYLTEGSDFVTLGLDSFPTARKIENADGSVKLIWKKTPGVQGYKVYVEQKIVRTDSDGDTYTNYVDVEYASLPGTAASYTFQPIADRVNYTGEYSIYAYNGNDYYEYYDEIEPTAPKIDKVNGISAVPNAYLNGITVSWAPVAGAKYYKVYRTRTMTDYNADNGSYGLSYDGTALQVMSKPGTLSADGTYYEVEPEYTTEIAATSVTDAYLAYAEKYNNTIEIVDVQKAPKQGVRYYYYVIAYGDNGQPIDSDAYESFSSRNSSKPATAVLNNVTVAKPSIKKVTSPKKGSATISWKKSAGAQRYMVYVSAKKKSGYAFAGVTTGNKITLKGLQPGKTYYFQVKAVAENAAGGDVYSSLSKAKSVKVK